jgi:hypothetical protein
MFFPMTSRQRSEIDRSIPASVVFVLIIILVGVLLAAGCENVNYLDKNHEILVGKLNSDGTQDWLLVINDSIDNAASDIIQLSDGNYAISGSSRHKECRPHFGECKYIPTLIVVSDIGNLTYKNELNESSDIHDPTHILQTANKNITLVSTSGIFWDFDERGNLVKRQKLNGGVQSIFRTGENDYIFSYTQSVIKMDNRFNISWKQSYANQRIESFHSIVKQNNGDGYFALATGGRVNNSYPQYSVFLDSKGRLENITRIEGVDLYSLDPIESLENGYRIYYSSIKNYNGGYTYSLLHEMTLDRNGSVTNKRTLNFPRTFTKTTMGEFCIIGFNKPQIDPEYADIIAYTGKGVPVNDKLSIAKSKNDGSIIWNTTISAVTAHTPIKIIQTADGGFTFLAIREK